jgi:hypothetical protein
MSIHNIVDKIKGVRHEDTLTILYICVVCVVGVGGFGLGRLSSVSVGDIAPVAILEAKTGSTAAVSDVSASMLASSNTQSGATNTMRYVASKNGKLYYSSTCSGAKRIKIENQVWFNTESDAQKSGYTRATSCK